jgi:predicted aspartyl protease
MVEHFFDKSKPVIPVLVSLNGKKGLVRVQAVVSTGSTFVCIPEEVAETMGYDVKASKEKVKIETPCCVLEVPLITLDEVSVLGISAPMVKTAIVPFPEDSRVSCILGLTYLRNFSVAIDYQTGSLTME